MVENDKLMSTRELANYLGLTEASIRNRRAKGLLPCIKIGKTVRYSKVSIDNLLKQEEAWGIASRG